LWTFFPTAALINGKNLMQMQKFKGLTIYSS
jgi:hypothetical protein